MNYFNTEQNTRDCFSKLKHLLTITALCLIPFLSKGQPITRKKGETKEQVVGRLLGKNAALGGPVKEYVNDTSSVIIYFQIQTTDSSDFQYEFAFAGFPFPQVQDNGTLTLFNVLYSSDNIHYTKYVIDTLDVNSGCCPCHMPLVIDSVLPVNIDADRDRELCLILNYMVRSDCNSLSTSALLFYDAIETFAFTKKMTVHPFKIYTDFRGLTGKEIERQVLSNAVSTSVCLWLMENRQGW